IVCHIGEMAEAEQRQHRLGDDLKTRLRAKSLSQRSAPAHVRTDHLAQAIEPVCAQKEPQFERAKAPAQRHRPFGIVYHSVPAVRLQVFRLYRKGAHQIVWLAKKVRRAVKLRAEPFMRIEYDGIGVFNAGPEVPEIRADHRRPRPGSVNMEIQPVPPCNRADGSHIIRTAGAGTANGGDDASRNVSSLAIRAYGGIQ